MEMEEKNGKKTPTSPLDTQVGDRIAQLVFHFRPAGFMDFLRDNSDFSIQEKDILEWPKTDRGNNGYGSTGRK